MDIANDVMKIIRKYLGSFKEFDITEFLFILLFIKSKNKNTPTIKKQNDKPVYSLQDHTNGIINKINERINIGTINF